MGVEGGKRKDIAWGGGVVGKTTAKIKRNSLPGNLELVIIHNYDEQHGERRGVDRKRKKYKKRKAEKETTKISTKCNSPSSLKFKWGYCFCLPTGYYRSTKVNKF